MPAGGLEEPGIQALLTVTALEHENNYNPFDGSWREISTKRAHKQLK